MAKWPKKVNFPIYSHYIDENYREKGFLEWTHVSMLQNWFDVTTSGQSYKAIYARKLRLYSHSLSNFLVSTTLQS